MFTFLHLHVNNTMKFFFYGRSSVDFIFTNIKTITNHLKCIKRPYLEVSETYGDRVGLAWP